jgi:DNA-binding transcriptional LysR family regulator
MSRYAAAIVNEVQAAGEQLAAIEHGASALLRVGSFSTMALLPLAVARLRRDLPGVVVRLHEQPPRQLVALIAAGELDCAVSALPLDMCTDPAVDGLRVEAMLADRLCVVCAPDHPLAGETRLTWADAVGHDWVLPSRDSLMRQALIAQCIRQGLTPPSPVVESLSALTARWLVRFDRGLLGVMRLHQATEEAALGLLRILPVRPSVPLPQISLISRRDAAVSQGLVASFGRALRAARGSDALRRPAAGTRRTDR